MLQMLAAEQSAPELKWSGLVLIFLGALMLGGLARWALVGHINAKLDIVRSSQIRIEEKLDRIIAMTATQNDSVQR